MNMVWVVVAIVGIVAQAVANRLVVRKRIDTWRTMGTLYAVLIPLVLLSGAVALTITRSFVLLGVATALLFFGATRLFITAAAGWGAFSRDAGDLFAQRTALPVPLEVVIGGVVAIGEELFWRGLVVVLLTGPLGLWGAALMSWLLFVGVNLVSGSRALVVGAMVGGALWTLLAVTESLSVAVVCHTLWTVLMVAWPPPRLPLPTADKIGSHS